MFWKRPLPGFVRPASSFLLVLFLAACEAGSPSAAASDAEADRLLASADPATIDAAFEALAARTVLADLTVTQSDGDGQTLGTTTARVEVTPDGARVLRQSGDGALATPPDEPPRFRNPLDTALPDDPPYADPASRDQYRRAVVGDTVVAGRRLQVVEAVLADAEAEQGVRRVRAAVDAETGRPVTLAVDRAATSAVYDERSHVRVELAPVGSAWLPRTVETDTWTDVPLAPARRVRAVWTVLSVDGRPLAAETP